MSQPISGRAALVTGAARGQGGGAAGGRSREGRAGAGAGAAGGQRRAHAVRLSADGADIIAVDLAGPLPSSVPYDSPTPDDLAETARLVAANDRKVLTAAVDIRDIDALKAAVDEAV